jgi:hypothetical protein
MKKTVYLVVHVDYPEEMLLDELLSSDGIIPEFHNTLEEARKSLESYLEQGLEYNIRVLHINIE